MAESLSDSQPLGTWCGWSEDVGGEGELSGMDWRNAPVCPPQGVQSAGYPTRLYPETRQAGEAPAGRTDCIRPGAAAQHGRGAVRHRCCPPYTSRISYRAHLADDPAAVPI